MRYYCDIDENTNRINGYWIFENEVSSEYGLIEIEKLYIDKYTYQFDYILVDGKPVYSPTDERKIEIKKQKDKDAMEVFINKLPEDLSSMDEAICTLYEMML